MAGDLIFLDCQDCGECTCNEARDDYADSQVDFSGGPVAETYINEVRSSWECIEYDWEADGFPTPEDFAFDGIPNASTAIESECAFSVGSAVLVPGGVFGGVVGSAPTCAHGEPNIYGSSVVGSERYISSSGGVTYSCVDGVFRRSVFVGAYYWLHYYDYTLGFATATYPGWTWVTVNGPPPFSDIIDWQGTAVVGNVTYTYRMTVLFRTSGSTVFAISMQAASLIDSSVSLGSAPAHFDPFGLLTGAIAVT